MSGYNDSGLIDVLVIGSGAREHALVWKLLLSPKVERVYVAPGNGGTSLLAVPLPYDANSAANINLLANWVLQREIGFTMVGPEVPLAEGVVDVFNATQQPIVGPTQAAARIESSKDWAKQFMLRHNIPTAQAITFEEFEPLRQHLLAEDTSYPLVIKEDGLMAGKGVTIAHSRAAAIVWLARIAGTTIDRVVAADFVPTLPGTVAAPQAMPSAAAAAAAFGLPKSERDEDLLAAAIVKGMSAAQVEAIMRGEEVSRDQMLGTQAGGSASAASPLNDDAAPAKDSEDPADDVAREEDTLASDPVYLKLKHDYDELFRRDGRKMLVEEYIEGVEVSILAFSDGKTVEMMPPVCDYKTIGDGNTGPMTGGMGAYSPTSYVSAAQLDWMREHIIEAAIKGMAEEGHPYKGVLYAGLMMTSAGPKVLEFNSRFGDPETQVLMLLLETDLAEVCQAIIEERLAEQEVLWSSDACVAVVLAAPGYPDAPVSGQLIQGLDDVEPGVRVFHAGTRGGKVFTDIVTEMGGGERPSKKKIDWRTFLGRIDVPDFVTSNDNAAVKAMNEAGQIEMRTAGGRVLTVAATAPTLAEARAIAYRNAALINFPAKQMRSDIALREVAPVAQDEGINPAIKGEGARAQ